MGAKIDLMGKDWLLQSSMWHCEHIRKRHLFWTDATHRQVVWQAEASLHRLGRVPAFWLTQYPELVLI